MHPFLRNLRALGLYLAAWGAVALSLAVVAWRLRGGVPFLHMLLAVVPPTLAYGLVCLSALWVARAWPVGKTPPATLARQLLGATVQASAWWVGLAAPWTALMSRFGLLEVTRAELFIGYGALFVLGLPLYGMSLGLHYLMQAFEASREAERRALESQVAQREAEVRALRAQLNPHFLFNSLNSINALVGSDPEGARRMCASLGDFLRRTLALSARDSVTVAEELALVDQYLAIERVRFGARLQVDRRLEPVTEGCLVPPLLLQPLVENAVKHGIADRLEGGTVTITTSTRDSRLLLEVENQVDEGGGGRPGTGLGLENVRRRLDALAGRQARLDTRRENGHFRVTVTLPMRRPEEERHAGG